MRRLDWSQRYQCGWPGLWPKPFARQEEEKAAEQQQQQEEEEEEEKKKEEEGQNIIGYW